MKQSIVSYNCFNLILPNKKDKTNNGRYDKSNALTNFVALTVCEALLQRCVEALQRIVRGCATCRRIKNLPLLELSFHPLLLEVESKFCTVNHPMVKHCGPLAVKFLLTLGHV
jgi:hypothetical protein